MCWAEEVSTGGQLSVLLGSAFSIISIINNSILFYCLARHPRCFFTYFQFLLILCGFDIIVSACYIPVIGVDNMKDAWNSVFLARLWWSYFTYLLTATNVAMTASSYVLIGALVERYLITIQSELIKQFQRCRTGICVASVIIALVTKAPMLYELELERGEDNCTGTISEFQVNLAAICYTVWYGTVYRFWLRNLATIFLPFFLLFAVNIGTLSSLKSQLRSTRSNAKKIQIKGKIRIRSATWTMVLVCCMYLLSNLPNVVITFWEFIDIDGLMDNHFDFYMLSTDLVSLLVVISCAMRLPIYMMCNAELRKVVMQAFRGEKERRESATIVSEEAVKEMEEGSTILL